MACCSTHYLPLDLIDIEIEASKEEPELIEKVVIARDELDYFDNPSHLFKTIESNKTFTSLAQLEVSAHEAGKWVIRRSTDGSVSWRRLPIHEACIRGSSEALIDAIIKAYPLGVRETDACGRLPIHHACVFGASQAVIKKLGLIYPESVDVEDGWGKTPLSLAESSPHPNKNVVLQMLSRGVAYFYRLIVEEEWAVRFENEKQIYEIKLKGVDEKCQSKIAAIDETSRVSRFKMEGEVRDLNSQIVNMKSNEKLLLKENNQLKDKVKKIKDLTDLVITLSNTVSALTKSQEKAFKLVTKHKNELDGIAADRGSTLDLATQAQKDVVLVLENISSLMD